MFRQFLGSNVFDLLLRSVTGFLRSGDYAPTRFQVGVIRFELDASSRLALDSGNVFASSANHNADRRFWHLNKATS